MRTTRAARTYTDGGFAKGRVPDAVWGDLLTYYHNSRGAWARAVAEDMTGTLKPAAQSTLNAIAKAAMSHSKGKAEL